MAGVLLVLPGLLHRCLRPSAAASAGSARADAHCTASRRGCRRRTAVVRRNGGRVRNAHRHRHRPDEVIDTTWEELPEDDSQAADRAGHGIERAGLTC